MKTIQIKQYSSYEEPITVYATWEVANPDTMNACNHYGAMDGVDYANLKNGFQLDVRLECDKCGAVNEWGQWEHGVDTLSLDFWDDNLEQLDDGDNGDFEYDQWRDIENGL